MSLSLPLSLVLVGQVVDVARVSLTSYGVTTTCDALISPGYR
jgi:hypothetical protein